MPLFERWGLSHLSAILLTIAIPLTLARWARRDRTERNARIVASGLAALLITVELMKLIWARTCLGRSWVETLPLHLCDAALFATVLACLTRTQLAYELAYFWGLAGTMQGMLTPDLLYDFPTLYFWFFFLGHGGIIAGIIFLTAGMRLRPHWRSVVRAWIGLLCYALIAGAANILLGTNYGYLRAKPAVTSLLDFLGSWPWYIASMAALAAVFFTILYLPWKVPSGQRSTQPRLSSTA